MYLIDLNDDVLNMIKYELNQLDENDPVWKFKQEKKKCFTEIDVEVKLLIKKTKMITESDLDMIFIFMNLKYTWINHNKHLNEYIKSRNIKKYFKKIL